MNNSMSQVNDKRREISEGTERWQNTRTFCILKHRSKRFIFSSSSVDKIKYNLHVLEVVVLLVG
jgi:hypothetical protein